MELDQNIGAYSAHVEMWLIINGESVGITHMGPDFLLVEHGHEHPPGEAIVVLRVDRSERRWSVRLPEGIRPEQGRIIVSK